MANLFVYGSLMDADIFYEITHLRPVGYPAILSGFIRFKVVGESYPAVVEKELSSVEGLLYRDISESTFALLDQFEGEEYDRVSVDVTIEGKNESADLYRYKSEFYQKLGSELWDIKLFYSQREQFLSVCRNSSFVNSKNSM